MQQLFSAFGIDWRLLIAQAINFGIVIIALWYFLYRPVMRMLERRRAVVAKGVADAEAAAEKLSTADADASLRLRTAEAEAEEIMGSARKTAGEQGRVLLQEAEERANQIAKDAELRAKEQADQARRESEKDIARLALLAAEKVMRDSHA